MMYYYLMREIRFDYYIALFTKNKIFYIYLILYSKQFSMYNIVYTILYAVIIYNNYIK